MLYPLWTAKPGSGCTTTSLALASRLTSRPRARAASEVLLVDLGGDLLAAAGLAPATDGVTDWLAATSVGPEALARLEISVSPCIAVLPLGSSHRWPDDRADELRRILATGSRRVVVDVSTVEGHGETCLQRLRLGFADGSPSLLVTRPCYLALRRAEHIPVRPTGVVLVREPGRDLDRFAIARMLGAPVVAQIDHDPAIARAVDAGRLVRRTPRPLSRQLSVLVR